MTLPDALYKSGEPVKRTQYRIMHWINVMLTVVLLLWAIVAGYLAYGSTWTPWVTLAIAVAQLLLVPGYGDWAINRDRRPHIFAYLVLMLVNTVFLITVVSFAVVQIPAAQEYVEENWLVVQTQVIAFTTQLDAKRTIDFMLGGMGWIGWALSATNLALLGRPYERLGGSRTAATWHYGFILPESFLLLCLGVTAGGIGADAVLVSAYATEDTESALLCLIVASFFFLVLLTLAIGAFFFWGTHHTSHSLAALLLAPFSFITLVSGAVTMQRAEDVEAFVAPRWYYLQNFLPTVYVDQTPEKYIQASMTLLRQCGLAGVLVGLVGLIGSAFHVHFARVLVALDPVALATESRFNHTAASRAGVVGATRHAVHRVVAAVKGDTHIPIPIPIPVNAVNSSAASTLAAGSATPGSPSKFGSSYGTSGASPAPLGAEGGAVPPANLGAAAAVGAGASSSSSSSSSSSATGAGGSASESGKKSGAEGGKSLSKKERRMSERSMSTRFTDEDDEEEDEEEDEDGEDDGEGRQRGGGSARGDAAQRQSLIASSGRSAAADDGNAITGLGSHSMHGAHLAHGTHPSGALASSSGSAASSASSSLHLTHIQLREAAHAAAHAAELRPWPETIEYQWNGLRHTMQATWKCVAVHLGLAVVGIIAVAVGVSTLYNATYCELLTRSPPSITHSMNVTIGAMSYVNISHAFPRGSVRVDFYEPLANEECLTLIEFSMWSAEADRLWSFARFNESIRFFPTDPNGGFGQVLVINTVTTQVLDGDGGATAKLDQHCDTIQVVVRIPFLRSSDSVQSHAGRTVRMVKDTLEGLSNLDVLRLAADAEAEADAAFLAASTGTSASASASVSSLRRAPRPTRGTAGAAAVHRALRNVMSPAASYREALAAAASGGAPLSYEEMDAPTLAKHQRMLTGALKNLGATCGDSSPVLLTIFLSSTSSLINMTGTPDAQLPPFQYVNAHSTTGPVVLNYLLGSVNPFDPTSATGLSATSDSGRLSFFFIVLNGIYAHSTNDIRVRTVSAGYFGLNEDGKLGFYISGSMNVASTGSGRVLVTQGFGGHDVTITTEDGDIVFVTCGALPGADTIITTSTGNIVMSSYLQAAGNHTYVTTRQGTIKGSAVIFNRLDITATEGDIALYELFAGLSVSKDIVFLPPLIGNYSQPGLQVSTSEGLVTLIGIQALPGTVDFASQLQINIEGEYGGIKIEVNGGGFNGPYDLESRFGEVTVELDGVLAPPRGIAGDAKASNGTGSYFNASCYDCDIDFALLTNPL